MKLYLFQSAGVPAHYPNKTPAPRKVSAALGSRDPGLPAWPLRALGRLGIVALARRGALRRLVARHTCYILLHDG